YISRFLLITIKHKIFYSFFPKFSIKMSASIYFFNSNALFRLSKLFCGGISYYTKPAAAPAWRSSRS
ncbi:MAG: hypothetical protein ACLS55_12380, partial [Lachnospiraceae bacterium]